MIGASGIGVRRRGRDLLHGVTMAAPAGEVLGILGPNGAGKSTLLRVLCGELMADAGQVSMGGRPIGAWDGAALARHRAVLPQASVLGFPLTVAQVVALGRMPHGGPADPWCAIALARLEVGHLADRWWHGLSGGEQQRVQMARVLAQLDGPADPALTALLLDEPTASLDLRHQHAVLRIAREEAARGRAVVAVLHDLNQALAVCDRVLVLADGRVAAAGPPAVLTPALVRAVWDFVCVRAPHPVSGAPLLLPLA